MLQLLAYVWVSLVQDVGQFVLVEVVCCSSPVYWSVGPEVQRSFVMLILCKEKRVSGTSLLVDFYLVSLLDIDLDY